jgi:hypothetical protein
MKLKKILKELLETTQLQSSNDLLDNSDFMTWFIRFQEQKTKYVPDEWKLIKNEYDVINKTKKYTAYRGIFIKTPTDLYKKLKIGNNLTDQSTSWSLNKDVAYKFATDSHNFGGSKTNWKRGKSLGFMLEYTFDIKDVLFDLSYMDKNNFKKILYPREEEIIVDLKTRECKITNIIFDRMSSNGDFIKRVGYF